MRDHIDPLSIGLAVVIKAALVWRMPCCVTVGIFSLALGEYVLSPDFLKLLTFLLASGSLIYNAYANWKTNEIKRIQEEAERTRAAQARENAELQRQIETFQKLHQADAEIIIGLRTDVDGLRDDSGNARMERQAMQLELTQLSAEFLRSHGDFRPSGSPQPLRRFTAPPEDTEVLIAEDDEPTRKAFARVLRYYGFKTTAAATVEEALESLRTRATIGDPFDFVLMDIRFPGAESGGLDILRAIRQSPSSQTLAIVISSAIDDAMTERLKKHGATAILHKPIDKAELLAQMGLKLTEPVAEDGKSQ